ncbi:MAG: Hint domain-containing protein [Paracoccaceae bacterium]
MSIVSPIFPDDIGTDLSLRGFAHGTRIMTPRGWRLVEDLAVGDVLSGDQGQGVEIIATRRMMLAGPGAEAVCVGGEARGQGRGAAPLLLTPDQMIVVAGDRLAAYFGVEEALAPVGALVNGGDLRLIEAPMMEIWHDITLARACTIVVEGLQVAIGGATDAARPALSAQEARLLSLAA